VDGSRRYSTLAVLPLLAGVGIAYLAIAVTVVAWTGVLVAPRDRASERGDVRRAALAVVAVAVSSRR
jgi:hypothetical protein